MQLPLFPQMADKSDSGSLEIEQFVHFYKMLTQRDEVWKVFQDYSGDGERLMLEELELFLQVEQHEGEQSAQHAKELIETYEPSETGTGGDTILMCMFCNDSQVALAHLFMEEQEHV